jgi:hypothetical protein
MKLVPDASAAPNIDGFLVAIRPKLHRYCARMVGSVIDGEDVLQDALIKALSRSPRPGRSAIRKDGCFGSHIIPHWIFCAAAAGSERSSQARRWT